MSLRAPENDATCSAVAPHSTALARRIAETAAALNQAVAGQVRRRGRPRVADLRLEGVVIFHVASGALFKKTLDKDDEPKGAR